MWQATSIAHGNSLCAVATAAVGALLLAGAAGAQVSSAIAASGTFTQTEVLSQEVGFAGTNVILEGTAAGVVTGTITGTYVENSTVLLHANGRFSAQGTTSCMCTVDGKEGLIALAWSDTGEIVEGTPTYKGRTVINGGTGELSGLRGVLQIDGTVDLVTGLSTTNYSGQIWFLP